MTLDKFRKLVLSALLFGVFTTSTFYAQTLTSATVAGAVRDSTGAAAPEGPRSVSAKPIPALSAPKRAALQASIVSRFSSLEITKSTQQQQGFPVERCRSNCSWGRSLSVDLLPTAQSAQQTVVVQSENELLQTENGNNLTDYSPSYVENTPVNGGDITNPWRPALRLFASNCPKQQS